MGFFSKHKLRHAERKIGEIVTDICGVGATLMGRSYFGQNPPPIKYEKPPMVIGEIIEDICHTGDFH